MKRKKIPEGEIEYTSEEIFSTFINLRDLLLSVSGRIETTYVWEFINKDLRRQVKERVKK